MTAPKANCILLNVRGNFYYGEEFGKFIAIEEWKYERILNNPNLYYFSTALKKHFEWCAAVGSRAPNHNAATGSTIALSSEIRQAITVEPEIRRAVPVEPEIRRAMPIGPEIRKAVAVQAQETASQ